MRKIVLGTRGSRLALIQTGLVANALREKDTEFEIDTKTITTKGDVNTAPIPLDTIGKSWFTGEIEQELMAKSIDIAVHSLKDISSDPREDSVILPVLVREDPRDVLVSKQGLTFEQLPHGAIIGTDSSRRKAQILAKRSDLRVESIRGNIDTRLRKLREENYDAIVIAAAGLIRLSLANGITGYFDIETFVPAPGQGVLAVQIRADDEELLTVLRTLQDTETVTQVKAERAFVERIGGGCKSPAGACAKIMGDSLELFGMFANEDGSNVRFDTEKGSMRNAEEIGTRLANKLRRAVA
jgi:hydroxymethylbilane synthase